MSPTTGKCQGHQAARADALHGPKQDELNHPLGDARQQRPRQEDQDRGLEHDPPPIQITDLAVQRRTDGRAEQVRRDHPGVVIEAAQLTDDPRQSRGDNRLVKCRQQQPGHEAGEHQQDLAVRERLSGAGGHTRGRAVVKGAAHEGISTAGLTAINCA